MLKSGMGERSGILLLQLLLFVVVVAVEIGSAQGFLTCRFRWSTCFYKKIRCPSECPFQRPYDPHAKACFIDCYNPKCEAVCKSRKPDCNGHGAGCHDPRFIGGDGVVFYFHGRKDEHFALVSDPALQINARFIGLRPAGRTRDFTWIQALGLMSGSHKLAVEATGAEKWDAAVDHLHFSFDGESLSIPEGHLSRWTSSAGDELITVERTGRANSVLITLWGVAEISINVVPVTEEDDKIHGYGIPADDRFAHLEVQFKFFQMSPGVEGVLGRTYRPDFENPAKRGVAMPVVGGEDKYWTPSLLSPDCKSCVFSAAAGAEAELQGFPVVAAAEN